MSDKPLIDKYKQVTIDELIDELIRIVETLDNSNDDIQKDHHIPIYQKKDHIAEFYKRQNEIVKGKLSKDSIKDNKTIVEVEKEKEKKDKIDNPIENLRKNLIKIRGSIGFWELQEKDEYEKKNFTTFTNINSLFEFINLNTELFYKNKAFKSKVRSIIKDTNAIFETPDEINTKCMILLFFLHKYQINNLKNPQFKETTNNATINIHELMLFVQMLKTSISGSALMYSRMNEVVIHAMHIMSFENRYKEIHTKKDIEAQQNLFQQKLLINQG
mgnify:CR=1 FL=1